MMTLYLSPKNPKKE